MGEERKTVDNCFSRTKSTKQGVGEASAPSDNQRLCDLTGHVELKTVCPKGTGVRIPHPKIEELALQAQGVGIFVKDEYPSSKPHINAILFFNTFIFSSNESYSVKASTISVSFSKVGLTGYFLFMIKPFSQVSNFTVTLLFC